MTFLLDVNVLIALIDGSHVSHERAHAWFQHLDHEKWATCPITENGVIRIVGHPKYPNTPGSPAAVVEIVRTFRNMPGHVFWPEDISLTDQRLFDAQAILTPHEVTDNYLLGLAVAKDGTLATLDRRLSPIAVINGKAALHLIPASNLSHTGRRP